MGRQSLGGYLTAGQRSYTATMLSAAKTLGKGLSYLGESVSKMAGNNPRNYRAQSDEHKIKGMVVHFTIFEKWPYQRKRWYFVPNSN